MTQMKPSNAEIMVSAGQEDLRRRLSELQMAQAEIVQRMASGGIYENLRINTQRSSTLTDYPQYPNSAVAVPMGGTIHHTLKGNQFAMSENLDNIHTGRKQNFRQNQRRYIQGNEKSIFTNGRVFFSFDN